MADLQLLQYANYLRSAVDGLTVWEASTGLTLTLHTAAYSPDRTLDGMVDDLTDELATGDGYTQGGVTLQNAVSDVVDAVAWSQTWQAATDHLVGQLVQPTAGNGFVYMVAVAGTSGAGEPTWPTTVGQCVTDGTVEWVCVGRAVVTLTADDLLPAWPSFSAGPFRHVVLSDRNAGVATEEPLIGVYSFPVDQSGTGSDFDIAFSPSGLIAFPVP